MSDLLKKNSKWSIIELERFPVASLDFEFSSYKDEWLKDDSRQKSYETHKHTEAIKLVSSPYDWSPGERMEVQYSDHQLQKMSSMEIDNIYTYLEDIYCGRVIRSEIVKLKAMSSVRKHVDGGVSLSYGRRVHVPVITNEEVFFTVSNNTVNMKMGQLYEINNSLPHAVENNSLYDRVHIIIDIMPDVMLNYKI